MSKYWKKIGQIYSSLGDGRHPKLATHAANPLAIHLEGDTYRIFYSGRDYKNRSSVGAVDIDIFKQKIIADHYTPFFQHGDEGSFYADGVSIGNTYIANDIRYMLFMGWQAPAGKHWRGDIGRLIVGTDLTLKLESLTPFITTNSIDPMSLSYPWVKESKGGYFDMWYGSTLTWDAGNGEMLHIINHASSHDGSSWIRNGLAIPYELGVAQAFSRPTIVDGFDGDLEMWFSYRSGSGEKYRIGYAKSIDHKNWKLDLINSGISVSDSGWDSEMIEYPFVFDHKGSRFMLYNGNSHGKAGFGLAVLENKNE